MSFAPRQNWNLYREALRAHAASVVPVETTTDEAASMEAAFLRYADYYDTLQHARRQLLNDAALDDAQQHSRWQEKIRLRESLLAVFQALDARRDG